MLITKNKFLFSGITDEELGAKRFLNVDPTDPTSSTGGGNEVVASEDIKAKRKKLDDLLADKQKLLDTPNQNFGDNLKLRTDTWLSNSGVSYQKWREDKLKFIDEKVEAIKGQITIDESLDKTEKGYQGQVDAANISAGASEYGARLQAETARLQAIYNKVNAEEQARINNFIQETGAIRKFDEGRVAIGQNEEVDRLSYLAEEAFMNFLKHNNMPPTSRYEPLEEAKRLLAQTKESRNGGVESSVNTAYEVYDFRELRVAPHGFERDLPKNKNNLITTVTGKPTAPMKMFFIENDTREEYFGSLRPNYNASGNTNSSITTNGRVGAANNLNSQRQQSIDSDQAMLVSTTRKNVGAREIYAKNEADESTGEMVTKYYFKNTHEPVNMATGRVYAKMAVIGNPKIHDPSYISNASAIAGDNSATKAGFQAGITGGDVSANETHKLTKTNTNTEVLEVFYDFEKAKKMMFEDSLPKKQKVDMENTFSFIQNPYQRRMVAGFLSPILDNMNLIGALIRLFLPGLLNGSRTPNSDLSPEVLDVQNAVAAIPDAEQKKLVESMLSGSGLSEKEKRDFMTAMGNDPARVTAMMAQFNDVIQGAGSTLNASEKLRGGILTNFISTSAADNSNAIGINPVSTTLDLKNLTDLSFYQMADYVRQVSPNNFSNVTDNSFGLNFLMSGVSDGKLSGNEKAALVAQGGSAINISQQLATLGLPTTETTSNFLKFDVIRAYIAAKTNDGAAEGLNGGAEIDFKNVNYTQMLSYIQTSLPTEYTNLSRHPDFRSVSAITSENSSGLLKKALSNTSPEIYSLLISDEAVAIEDPVRNAIPLIGKMAKNLSGTPAL